MSKHIFWINSFPKSGNTILRAILSCLFFSDDGKFNFELIRNISQFEMSQRLNFIKAKNRDDFEKIDDIFVLSKYLQLAQDKTKINMKGNFFFLKTHYNFNWIEENYFTNDKITRGYIYVLRDPRDVAVSWSKHAKVSIEDAIDFITNRNSCIRWGNKSNYSMIPKNKFPKVFVSSWDSHVESWTNNNLRVPKLFIKYEDLINKKENIIRAIKFFFKNDLQISIKNFENKLNNILITTSFDYMKKIEAKEGFKESMPWTNFFRVGKENQWKDILSSDQIIKIENKCKKNLQKFNYL